MAVRKNKEDVFLSFHLRNTRNAAILSFVVYFLFIFAVAWFAIEELFTVFIGFSPVFIFLLLNIIALTFSFQLQYSPLQSYPFLFWQNKHTLQSAYLQWAHFH